MSENLKLKELTYSTRSETKTEDGNIITIPNPELIEKINEIIYELSAGKRGFNIHTNYVDDKLNLLKTDDFHYVEIARELISDNVDIMGCIKGLGYFYGPTNQVYFLGNIDVVDNIKKIVGPIYVGESEQDNFIRQKRHNSESKKPFNTTTVFQILKPFVNCHHVESIVLVYFQGKNVKIINHNLGAREQVTLEEVEVAAEIIYMLLKNFNLEIPKPQQSPKLELPCHFNPKDNSRADNSKFCLIRIYLTTLINEDWHLNFTMKLSKNRVVNVNFKYTVLEGKNIVYYDEAGKVYSDLVSVVDPNNKLTRKERRNVKIDRVRVVDSKGNVYKPEEACKIFL